MRFSSVDKERQWLIQIKSEFENICFQRSVRLKTPSFSFHDSAIQMGIWRKDLRIISLSRKMVESQPWIYVLEVLKHEMAHQYADEVLRGAAESAPHGQGFQFACEKLGLWPDFRGACVREVDLAALFKSKQPDRTMQRIEKLLALSQSDNENEASLAAQRAQDLLRAYNLTEASTSSKEAGLSDARFAFISRGHSRLQAFEIEISCILRDFFFVDVIIVSSFDAELCKTVRGFEIMGRATNVEIAEYVASFLYRTLETLFAKQSKSHPLSRSSFYAGVMKGFRESLENNEQQSLRAEPASGGLSAAMILLNDALVTKVLHCRYPKVRRSGGYSRKSYDSQAYRLGQSEGRQLKVRKGIHSTEKSPGGFLT